MPSLFRILFVCWLVGLFALFCCFYFSACLNIHRSGVLTALFGWYMAGAGDRLRATAVTRGWNGYRNEREHLKLTLEKTVILPLLPGLKPETFRSWVQRSNHWAMSARWIRMRWMVAHLAVWPWMIVSCLFFTPDEYGWGGAQAPHAFVLFFRVWEKWIEVHPPSVWPIFTCSSGHG